MHKLTRHQQMVLALVMLLVLSGWAVKAWRAAHSQPVPISAPGS